MTTCVPEFKASEKILAIIKSFFLQYKHLDIVSVKQGLKRRVIVQFLGKKESNIICFD